MNEAAADRNFKLAEQLYYAADYTSLSFEQYERLFYDPSGEWVNDTYGDVGYTKKAFVLRKATPQEQEKKIALIKARYAPKTGTPIANNLVAINDKLVNQPAPDFTVTTLDGKEVTLSSLKGKVVVLNYWFTQCRACVEEMPQLNAMVSKYKGNKDVVFLALDVVPQTTVEDIQKFQKRVTFDYQIALGGKDAAAAYEAKTFPANYLIDKDGVIRMGWVGANPYSVMDMDKMIPTLLNAKAK
ncbi:hypothetical protein C3K47_10450 [Solitalea longa]|uniref:Thioredoxin domain-containing protein n=2 Tax=Solitalea longa TaxID=2079460 RepID=A0A2S5A3B6_9SPHI|nr:hypothetical protein C3K47_10450 [Solitalea longa]